MKIIATLFFLSLASIAYAGLNSFFVVIAVNDGPHVAAAFSQRADFVAIPVSLRSDKSDPADRFAAVGSAKKFLASEVAKQKGWVIYDGPVSLSGHSNSKFSSSYSAQSQSDVTILAPLSETSDIFSISSAITRFIAQLSFPAKVEATIGKIELAVRDPQQYRPKLLKLIAEEAARTRDILASGALMKIEGLEGPVMVRQINEHEVELFIDYRLAIEKR